jgi:hypothetical protein
MTFLDIHRQMLKLKKQRKDLLLSKLNGRSQTFIAKQAKISPQRVNNWINISSELSEEEIGKIVEALNS